PTDLQVTPQAARRQDCKIGEKQYAFCQTGERSDAAINDNLPLKQEQQWNWVSVQKKKTHFFCF
ncbi:MAG: hypothetical protein IJL87_07895, partial [Clostridia bacterium]|nr:hypothetical protein [Clostridia bacterium]